MRLLAAAGARGPAALMLTLLHVRGWDLKGGDTGDERLVAHPIDRDDLIVPEVFLEDLAADPAAAFQAIFDPIWNAAGYPGSRFPH